MYVPLVHWRKPVSTSRITNPRMTQPSTWRVSIQLSHHSSHQMCVRSTMYLLHLIIVSSGYAQVSFDAMFHEHESIKSPLRKCMKAVYYWLMVANYAFCYAVCGMPLVCCWALLSSTSSYLYTFILQPCLIIMQLWGSILMIPIRSIAGNLLQQPLRHIIRAICLR